MLQWRPQNEAGRQNQSLLSGKHREKRKEICLNSLSISSPSSSARPDGSSSSFAAYLSVRTTFNASKTLSGTSATSRPDSDSCLLLLLSYSVFGAELRGVIDRIVDGDTFDFCDNQGWPFRVRSFTRSSAQCEAAEAEAREAKHVLGQQQQAMLPLECQRSSESV